MVITCKFLSEALIFASTNPQYDNRLFIELQVQYMKIPSSNGEHVVYRHCFRHSDHFLYTRCSPHVLLKEELLKKNRETKTRKISTFKTFKKFGKKTRQIKM